jgi:hypothetical protein
MPAESVHVLYVCGSQGFDWDALAARRMEPPRRPKTSDHSKRKVGA